MLAKQCECTKLNTLNGEISRYLSHTHEKSMGKGMGRDDLRRGGVDGEKDRD